MAMMLQKEHSTAVEVRDFLMAEARTCAIPDQVTPQGYYNFGACEGQSSAMTDG
jgi:uncharacterized protein involved in oxidation of intracellular sulfur